jgi:predicted transcriptional regulator
LLLRRAHPATRKKDTLTTLWTTPVREYASNPLISVRPETPLVDVQEVLLEHDISAVAVVDDRGELKGILSSTDLLREARIELAGPRELARITPPPRKARDLMRRDVVTVDEDAPLHDAARQMVNHRIHRVVVTRGGAPAGVLSTRDAMCAVLRQRIETPLEQVMTTPVETIDEGDTIRTAIERLDDANVRGLVVVDGRWPIGVFTHTEAIHARALPSMFLDSPVERVMSYETICLDVKTPLHRVAGHAIQMHVRRILAVHARELRGIVSGFDIVRVMTTM